jgi:hypothetical protein
MIVVVFGTYVGKIHHDHGNEVTPGLLGGPGACVHDSYLAAALESINN